MKLYFTTLCIVLISGISEMAVAQKTEFLYVGTFSVRGSEGIYIFSFDRTQGKFEPMGAVHSLNDPTFLAVSPDKKFLYSANRQSVDSSSDKGSVTSYRIHPQTGLLTETSRSSSFGNSPCHISISKDGKWLFASHYRDGSLVVLSTDKNGKISGLADSVIHKGSSVDKLRQETAHAHSTNFIPDTDYFMTADLGSDKLWVYKWNSGTINPAPLPFIASVRGSGPRHFVFLPGKPWVYVAEELSSTVSVYDVNIKKATIKHMQRISTLPNTFTQTNSVADIHLSPDLRFLYVSNRGHNSLSIFKVDYETGKLSPVGHQFTLGKTPRNFYMDTLGEFVLVANQDSDDIFFFKRDKTTGMLQETGLRMPVPSPVCLKMVRF